MEETMKLENLTRHWIAELEASSEETMRSNQVSWVNWKSNLLLHNIYYFKASLEARITELTSNAETQMGQCQLDVEQKLKKFVNAKEKVENQIEDVEDKIEGIKERLDGISEQRELGEHVERLKSRVNNITNKMNLFVQNVLMVKNTQNMVNDIQKRIEFLEKQRLE